MESFVAASEKNWDVIGLPAFQDNYLWLLVNKTNNQCIVVDPGCADTVLAYLQPRQLDLTAILVTHHHPDHIGGLRRLLECYPSAEVLGTSSGRIDQVTKAIEDDANFTLDSLSAHAMVLPGHTIDHMAYLVSVEQQKWLFCGDTLFVGGCGRLFEGSHEQMFKSLQRLSQLSDDTLVFCAHEYTLSNYRFLHHYAPNDAAVKNRLTEIQYLRQQGLPTVPSTIGQEKASNLFLRASTVDSFRDIRRSKDSF